MDKSNENEAHKKSSYAPAATNQGHESNGSSSFTDNRPTAIAQRKLNSMAQQSPQAQYAVQMKSVLNGGIIQRREALKKNSTQLKSKDTTQLKETEKGSTINERSGLKGALPENIQNGIHAETGMDMSGVNVHYNSQAPSQLGAHAYTKGNDIHVAPNQEKHVAHEAWHVVQQEQGRVKATTNINSTPVNDNAGLEKEADVMGAKISSGANSAQLKRNKSSDSANSNTTQLQKDQGDTSASKSTESAEATSGKKEEHVPEHAVDKEFTKEQGKQIGTAITAAHQMAVKAQGNIDSDNALYKKWLDNSSGFIKGMFKKSRVKKVKKCFDRIVKTLEEEKITFKEYALDDGEKDITYAYVHRNKLRNIYLGGVFWKAPMTGLNSKAGTIIHELTHKLYGSKDHVYGTMEAMELAINSPGKAVKNADNLEYFAETS